MVAEGVGKREDLRVVVGEGHIIVEVKGYGKGARANDLIHAEKVAGTYAARFGRLPHGRWLVLNANRLTDPSLRDRVFRGADDAVESTDFVIIDTRYLFRLVRDVELELLDPQEATAILLDAPPGMFVYETRAADEPS